MPQASKIKDANYLSPSSKYDYDGIAGTWLAIPPIVHLIFAIIALAVLLFLLPHISFRGPLKYIFSDYQVPIGIAIALFFSASALLSKLKSYQVNHKTGRKSPQKQSANKKLAKSSISKQSLKTDNDNK